jgi:cation diffusion facilitator family transporter
MPDEQNKHPDRTAAQHDYAHNHDEDHVSGWRGWIANLFHPGGHSHVGALLDPAMANQRGIWALKVSLAGLLITALFQVGVVAISGSVALLADTLHNFSDALTAIPLWLAFSLARRSRDRRFTYGYGRAEDLAGVLIVVMIFASALLIFYETYQKIMDPQPLSNLVWVAAAALIGFAGNELVAIFRIRVGSEIGSAALVADGKHARTDGLTSLGVLAGVIGVWLGYPLADPLVGSIIGLAILWIGWGAGGEMWLRMMDAVDPSLSKRIDTVARSVEGVIDVHDIALRWLGHRQRGEVHIVVDGELPTYASHRIAEEVRHALFHALPALVDMTVHIDPIESDHNSSHRLTDHHRS